MGRNKFALMLNITKIISTSFDDIQRRLVKVLRKGNKDIQTPLEASPFGIDSNPLKDMIAVYGPTEEKGKTVIIGYIDKNKLADIGETRLYSTDSDGNLKFYTWLKNDGTMEIGGNTKHMVRYEELETAFNQLKADFNAHITKYNAHIHLGVIAGFATSGIPTVTDTASSADISPAKIDEIKTL
jgi:hypothetical protein